MAIEDQRRIEDKLDTIGGQVAATRTDVAAIKAKQETSDQRVRAEMQALFQAKEDHSRRISSIERDYTPKTDFNNLENRFIEESTRNARASGRIGAILGIFAGVTSLLGGALAKWLFG